MDIKKQQLEDYYYDLVMNCPVEKGKVWDIECHIRDIVEEKGYDLINFCSFPLFIKGRYMGNYNSIKGYSKQIKYLFRQIKGWGYECYYRKNYEKSSESHIIFPKNLIYELEDNFKKNLKNYNGVESNEIV